ncbi:hypothetical protein [Rhizobium sp. 18055]|jgi:hypothetical protein|uniref:hypothetical protein n=1 Tax=Rhizobium sp. 18055 TaxID=2681403 RepID=UPI001356E368|nr:hypothetical protein [Rhizobium sp. 18055]
MECDTGFAKSCFPNRATLINDLAARDGDFRELCNDFATADALRVYWETSSDLKRHARHAEAVELLENLRAEIRGVLDNAAVIPFPRRPK